MLRFEHNVKTEHSRSICPRYRGTSLIKNPPPPKDPTAALGLAYGDPRGVVVSYERGTPVCASMSPGLGPYLSQNVRSARPSFLPQIWEIDDSPDRPAFDLVILRLRGATGNFWEGSARIL